MRTTIGIIGAGNMGGAIYRELTRAGFSVLVCDRSYAKAHALAKKNASRSLADLLEKADNLIFAVKPQSFAELAGELQGKANKKFIISIMAGVAIKKISSLTGASKIVRAMPNLPAQVGMGVTEWVASIAVAKSEKFIVKKMFGALGLELEVKKEEMIGKLTTISGCGPAYFFYLTELLTKQARVFGLNQDEAEKIAIATLAGSAQLLITSNKTAADWRQAVTSKGGTTESVLKHLEVKKWDKIFIDAIKKGKIRNDQLS